MLIADLARFDNVTVIGVDEHVWWHTRRGEKYVTVIIDLAPVKEGKGPARLLDMVDGRSKQVFKTWLAARAQAWPAGIEVIAMDGCTGWSSCWTRRRQRSKASPARRTTWNGPSPRPPRGAPRRRQSRRAPRPEGRSALQGQADPAHRRERLDRQAGRTHRGTLRGRGARARRSDLGHLPADGRRLQAPRPSHRGEGTGAGPGERVVTAARQRTCRTPPASLPRSRS